MNTIREQILQALAARVNATRVLSQADLRDLPATAIAVGEDAAEETQYGMTSLVMPVAIARALPLTGEKSDDWETEANNALGDLVVEFYAGDDDTLGGLCQGLHQTSQVTERLSDGSGGVLIQAFFNVPYQVKHGNPYSNTDE